MTEPQTARPLSRTLRYLAPNLVTAMSIVCAVLSVQQAMRGEIVQACWWVVYSTLTDKLDGIVARAVKGSSPLGVQMDSLADLLNYGFAPAAIAFAFFSKHPELGWATGWQSYALSAICCLYALSAAVRLARFNVSEGNPNFFFGIPSTFAGGIAVLLMITLCKYGDPAWTPTETYPGWRMLGTTRLDEVTRWYPIMLLGLAWTMISAWRVPKAGKMKSKLANIYVVGNLVAGWGAAMLHLVPEYMVFGSMQYMLIAGYAHFFSTPKEKPEPIFPA